MGDTRAPALQKTSALTDDEWALMREHTILGAAAILGIARHAMERAAMGAGVQRGTAALIRLSLAKLAEESRP